MNGVELRYQIFKGLTDVVYGASLISPVPGQPLAIGVLVRDPSGKERWFRVSVEEADGPEISQTDTLRLTRPA